MSQDVGMAKKAQGQYRKWVLKLQVKRQKRMVVFYVLYMLILAHKVVIPFEVLKNKTKPDSSEIEYKQGKP
jgi:hypothetical protein